MSDSWRKRIAQADSPVDIIMQDIAHDAHSIHFGTLNEYGETNLLANLQITDMDTHNV